MVTYQADQQRYSRRDARRYYRFHVFPFLRLRRRNSKHNKRAVSALLGFSYAFLLFKKYKHISTGDSGAHMPLFFDFQLNTNRLKVKTKAYRVEVAFDSNIGKYEGHIVNTDFLKDFPTGTIVATLVTGHDMHGYGLHNATWSIFDNNLIANATMAGTYNATVTWLYL